MARRFHGNRVRTRPSTKVWIGVDLGPTASAADTDVLLGVLSAGSLSLRPFTVLRTHLELFFDMDQQSANEQPSGYLGIGVFSDTATALGITALPNPLDEPEQDWFVYQGMNYQFVFTTGVGYITGGVRKTIDSKAMRKVGLDDDVAIMWASAASFGASIRVQGRMLLQLH